MIGWAKEAGAKASGARGAEDESSGAKGAGAKGAGAKRAGGGGGGRRDTSTRRSSLLEAFALVDGLESSSGSRMAQGPGLDGWCGIPWDSVSADPWASADSAADLNQDSDPTAEASDGLLDLGNRIASLAATIHAATHRLLVMIADFDVREGWKEEGHINCADWLAFRTGVTKGTAREQVRAARALRCLPRTSAALAKGELSFAKVRAITRAAKPETEEVLVEAGREMTAAALERFVRSWKRMDRRDEAEWERELHRSRTVTIVPDDDGMYVLRGRLDAEVGALLMRAIDAASDVLHRARHARGGTEGGEGEDQVRLQSRVMKWLGGPDDEEVTPAQRRADAIGLLAEQGLGVGFGGRAERYQVVLHVDADTLSEDRDTGRSHLADGTRVSAETSRRLACDAAVVRMGHAPDGALVDVGRRTRTIPPATRRALEARDLGCRFPGCGRGYTDAHHVRHWADGGETRLGNLILLCKRHHRMLHEEGWRIEWRTTGTRGAGGRGGAGTGVPEPVFYSPRGLPIPSRPPRVRLSGPVVRTVQRENREAGVPAPDWQTARARYSDPDDLPLDLQERAAEAVMAGEQAEVVVATGRRRR